MKTKLMLGLAALALMAGCSSYNNTRGLGDSPVGAKNDGPAKVTNFPDGFENVAFKCMGVNGIYTSTRDAAPVVVPNDPECKNGGS